MDERKYFWEDLIAHPKDPNGWLKGREYFEYKLKDEKDFIDLSFLYVSYIETFIPDNYPQNTATQIELRNSDEYHEKFLTYLLPILEAGKLKVAIKESSMRFATKEELAHFSKLQGKQVINEYSMYLDKDNSDLTPHESIDLIRTRWNAFTDPGKRRHFEEWQVHFTLPETLWNTVI